MESFRYHDLGRIAYADALEYQTAAFEVLLDAKATGKKEDNQLFFCEHLPVLTIGKSGKDSNLLIPEETLRERGVSFYHINRGGDITYHGRCVKLKIGAIGLEEELDLLRFIRRHFPAREVELRVDANGAFAPAEALDKLKRLAELDLHSIEQPIRAGQWDEMAGLTSVSPLPVAFDEELIGHCSLEAKRRLLDALHPQYIVLKPSLHGGFSGCREWIED